MRVSNARTIRLLAGTLLGASGLAIAQRALQFLTLVFLARVLGAESFGKFSYALALVALVTVPAQLGLPPLVIRETARYLLAARPDLIRGLLQAATALVGAASILTTLLAGTLALWIFNVPSLDTSTLIVGLVLPPVVALSSIWNASVCGYGHVLKSQLADQLVRPGLFLLCTSLLYLLSSSTTPVQVMSMYVGASVVGALVTCSVLYRITWKPISSSRATYDLRRWWQSVIPFLLLAVLQILNTNVDILILGAFASASETGVYRAVSQLAGMSILGLAIVNGVIGPRLAHLHASGDSRGMQRLVTSSAELALISALPIAFVLLALGKPTLAILFGNEFESGSVPLAILALGQLLNAALGSVGLILSMTGHERYAAYGLAIGAVANIGLNLLLVPHFGMIGAAIASSFSIVVWNVVLAYGVWSRTGLISFAFVRR